MSIQVPYLNLSYQYSLLKKDILSIFEKTIDSSNFILGPEVESFEKNFSQFTHSQFTIALNSGTSALHLALLLLNIQPDDEIITTPFTFAATAWAISYLRAKPVFVDIHPSTFCINPSLIENAITPKTKAILPVHLFGHPADLLPIHNIAKKYNLHVVEDAAQAHGALYHNQPIGSSSILSTYSFYPTKNIGACGEGGALCTNDPLLAQRAYKLRNHGSSQRYLHEEVGYNYRLEAIQASILNLKLQYLQSWTNQRRSLAHAYTQALSHIPHITLPSEAPNCTSVFHLYTIRTPKRDALASFLQKHNIGSSVHYPLPLHLQPCYQYLNYKPNSLPEAEKASSHVLSLPLYPGLSHEQILHVANTISLFFSS